MRNDLFLFILIIYQFVIYYTAAQCDGAVRLSGVESNEWGSPEHYGFIEIYLHGQYGEWGTICDDQIDDTTNPIFTVVCAELGYDTVIEGYYDTVQPWGSGIGSIWLDDVYCVGGEEHPALCPHEPCGGGCCGHDEDISVRCGDFTGEYGGASFLGVNLSCAVHDDCMHCQNNVCINNVCSLEGDVFVDILDGLDTQCDAVDALATQNNALTNVVDTLTEQNTALINAVDTLTEQNNVLITEVSELTDKLDKCNEALFAETGDSSDENANALMENHKMDNNDNDIESYQSISVEFTESTFVFVVVSALVIISVSICFYFYYNKK